MASQEALARENHRVAELRFQQGQGTSLDVVDAWLSLEKASLERLAASGEAWTAALETDWSEGRVERFATLWNEGGAR
jgi:outer membrane protein TolC